MRANACGSRWLSISRRLILLPPLMVGVSLALAGPASAQGGFQATVTGITPKPKPCPNGDVLCGSATTNHGDATWTFNPSNEAILSDTCASYEATVTFALGDGSTLVLDDNGTLCEPGQAFLAPGNALHSFGNPFYGTGSWTVQRATGQFRAIAVGSGGTDSLHLAGAQVSGAYTGTS